MTKKFDQVPVEEDTKIIFQQETKFGQYDVLYQKWFWDGITAESLIFANEDIAGIDKNEIVEQVRSSPLLKDDKEITFKKSDSGFTFVNFNFKID
jgi:hypothetical protein